MRRALYYITPLGAIYKLQSSSHTALTTRQPRFYLPPITLLSIFLSKDSQLSVAIFRPTSSTTHCPCRFQRKGFSSPLWSSIEELWQSQNGSFLH